LSILRKNSAFAYKHREGAGHFSEDIFNDDTEEALAAEGLPLYTKEPVAEMLDVALGIVSQNPNGFMIVAEEEGTDNFANNNNAAGTLKHWKRADDAIGVAQDFIDKQDPNTLLITAADSEAGGLQVSDPPPQMNQWEPWQQPPQRSCWMV